ncbi:MAG: hypothetical protein ACK4L7_06865, partial [Flavobacteriales bacterium]
GRGVEVQRMELLTPRSDVHGGLALRIEDWSDFNAFTSKVGLRLDLEESRLDMADIAWFAPKLEGIRLPLAVSGSVRGTVGEVKGRGLRIGFGKESWFRGNAELSGLPDLAETFMLIDVEELHATQADLAALPVPPFTSGARLALPQEASLLGDIDASGRFTGFLRAFTATGRARTALGELRTDLSYERDARTEQILLAGRAATQSFRFGPLLGTGIIGPLGANVRLKAKGRSLQAMEADLEGEFPLLTVNGRAIGGIRAKGHLARNLFDGELEADDPGLRLRFAGLADFRGRWPLVDYKAKVHHADLRALGFVNDAEYSALSLDMEARGRLSPDSLQGDLHLLGISYCRGDDEFDLGDAHLRSDRFEGRNILRLDATFAEAEVVGEFLPTRLPAALGHVVRSVFPSLSTAVRYDQDPQDFRFSVKAREAAEVLRLFAPGAAIEPGSTVVGKFDTRTFDLGLQAFLPSARHGASRFDSLAIIADKTLDLLAFSVRSSRLHVGDSLWFAKVGATGKAYQDELDIDVGWEGSSGGTHGNLSFTGEVRGPGAIDLELLPSRLYLGRGTWSNDERAGFRIDSSKVEVRALRMRNGQQRVAFDGAVSRDPRQPLAFAIEELELANLDPLIDGPPIHGRLWAEGSLYDVFGTPHVACAARADSVTIKGIPVGDLRFAAEWLEGQGALDLRGEAMRGPLKALDFSGTVGLRDGGMLDLDVALDRFDLSLLDPYLPEGIGELGGTATGHVLVAGPLLRPDLRGAIDLAGAGLRIDYLNTRYTLDARMRIGDELFAIDHAVARDEQGNMARIGATVAHHGLRHWSF